MHTFTWEAREQGKAGCRTEGVPQALRCLLSPIAHAAEKPLEWPFVLPGTQRKKSTEQILLSSTFPLPFFYLYTLTEMTQC